MLFELGIGCGGVDGTGGTSSEKMRLLRDCHAICDLPIAVETDLVLSKAGGEDWVEDKVDERGLVTQDLERSV